MAEIRKLLDLINETTVGATSSGGVASLAQSFHDTEKRVSETSEAPPVIEYGNWENSALTTSKKLKGQRKHAAKIVKSVYGEDMTSEEVNPDQQAAIAINKQRQRVKESNTLKSVSGTTEKDVFKGSLDESDLILNPAGMSRLSRGFVAHDHDRTDHEVEMARGDLYQASKNAKLIFDMIRDLSEEQGLEGWVSEKIITAADYLNTVREYLEGKQVESIDGLSPGTTMFTSEGQMKCPECGGAAYDDEKLAESQDACYHKVKSRYKVWPSAYASGALVKCRKVGATNWGNKAKK